MTTEEPMLEAIAARIPANCEWSTGTGTKRSHAQIISPVRRHSFYAVADSEAEALEAALRQLKEFRRP